MIEFFMPMIPPTCTHQEKKVAVIKGKPVFYDPPEVNQARIKLCGHLAKHKPEKMYNCGVSRGKSISRGNTGSRSQIRIISRNF